MKTCPYCQKENEQDAPFCVRCGADLVEDVDEPTGSSVQSAAAFWGTDSDAEPSAAEGSGVVKGAGEKDAAAEEAERKRKEKEAEEARQAELEKKRAEARRKEEETRQIAELARERRARKRSKCKTAVVTALEILALLWPLALTIASAVVIFTHKLQITIESSYEWVVTGWVALMLATFVATPILFYKIYRFFVYSDAFPHVSTVCVALISFALSCVLIGSAELSPSYDPTTFIELTITDKEDASSYSRFETVISFDVTNNSSVDVSYFETDMEIYDGETLVGSYFVRWYDGCPANSTTQATVTFTTYDDSDLFEIDYADLSISSRITKMQFNGNLRDFVFEGGYKRLPKIAKAGDSSTSGGDASPDVTTPSSSLLKNVQAYAGAAAILPDNYATANVGTPDVNYYSYYDNADHDSYYVFFTVSEEYHERFLDDFVAKLLAAGYHERHTEYGDHEYAKGDTVIGFSSVCESWVWTGAREEFEYYYFNYYAFHS